MTVLVTMSKCLQRTAKECDVDVANVKNALQDELLKALTSRFVQSITESVENDVIKDAALYYLCGYMLHARPSITKCQNCKETVQCEKLQLPSNFTAAHYTAIISRGHLVFVTIPFFQCFQVIEKVIETHFLDESHIYACNSFQMCISNISKCSLLPVFCDEHRDKNLPYIIREYVGVRFHLESKRLKQKMLASLSSKAKTYAKVSKHT